MQKRTTKLLLKSNIKLLATDTSDPMKPISLPSQRDKNLFKTYGVTPIKFTQPKLR